MQRGRAMDAHLMDISIASRRCWCDGGLRDYIRMLRRASIMLSTGNRTSRVVDSRDMVAEVEALRRPRRRRTRRRE